MLCIIKDLSLVFLIFFLLVLLEVDKKSNKTALLFLSLHFLVLGKLKRLLFNFRSYRDTKKTPKRDTPLKHNPSEHVFTSWCTSPVGRDEGSK